MESLVFCIGNRDGGDDAIGPYIADQLPESTDLKVIDCGTIPENYTSVVKQYKPKQLLLIDAVDMGLSVGEIRIVPKEKIGQMHISTHGIPLSVLMTYLEQYAEKVVLIGIQPKHLTRDLSPRVQQSGNMLIQLLQSNKIDQLPILH